MVQLLQYFIYICFFCLLIKLMLVLQSKRIYKNCFIQGIDSSMLSQLNVSYFVGLDIDTFIYNLSQLALVSSLSSKVRYPLFIEDSYSTFVSYFQSYNTPTTCMYPKNRNMLFTFDNSSKHNGHLHLYTYFFISNFPYNFEHNARF